MPGDTAALVDALYEAYNDHDPDAVAGLYAASGSHHEVAQRVVKQGRNAIRDGLAHLLEAFPDARWEERGRVIGETDAAVTYTLTGTLRAPLGPFKPQEQRLELQGVHILHLDTGSIVASEDYWDAATFGRQMVRP